MEKTYVIGWKSKSEPRWGQGKKFFTREEALALAAEMNRDYPAFIHEALDLAPAGATVDAVPTPEPAIIHIDFVTTPAETREVVMA
jgi:hypothetical protein